LRHYWYTDTEGTPLGVRHVWYTYTEGTALRVESLVSVSAGIFPLGKPGEISMINNLHR